MKLQLQCEAVADAIDDLWVGSHLVQHTTRHLQMVAWHSRHRLLQGRARGPVVAVGLGTVLGNLFGALSLSTLLVTGAGAPPTMTFGWLVGVQTAAGAVEGLLAAASVAYLLQRAPSLLVTEAHSAPRALDERVVEPNARLSGYAGVLVLLGVALLALPFASQVPDALEVVLERLGRFR